MMEVNGKTNASERDRLRTKRIANTLLFVALLVATRPWYGLVHDARMYALQALNAVNPGRFTSDLFLKYGSQDSFSAFTALYRYPIAWLGPSGANVAGVIVGGVLWLATLAYFMGGLFRNQRTALIAMAAAIALCPYYGGADIFSYAEPFTTPRLFAEALSLIALGSGMRGRPLAAALAAAIAAALHPLTALGPIGVLLVLAGLKDRRLWLLALAAGVIGAVLILTRIGPAGRALQTLDPEWARIVLKRDFFAFITRWSWWEVVRLILILTLLLVGASQTKGRERSLILAIFFVATGYLALDVVAGDLVRDLLVVNLQLWRILWLATLVTNALIVVLASRLPEGYSSKPLLATTAAIGAAASFVSAVSIAFVLILMVAVAVLIVETLGQGRPLGKRAAFYARGFAAAGLALAATMFLRFVGYDFHPWGEVARAVTGAAVILLLAFGETFGPLALASGGAGLIALAVALEPGQSPWDRYVFSPPRDDGLAAFVAGAGLTYWESDQGRQLLWFRLGRPSYFSCTQGSGAMFYRTTATDFARRSRALSPLHTVDFGAMTDQSCGEPNPTGHFGPGSPAILAAACRALPDLDTAILDRPIPGAAPAKVWRAPAAQQYKDEDRRLIKIDTFYRYSCSPR